MITINTLAGRVDFFRRLILNRDSTALQYLKENADFREPLLNALDESADPYLTQAELESIDLKWFAEVSEVLYGPEPNPPDIENELGEISDYLEDQSVMAGRLLLELIDSSDLPDGLRQLGEFFNGLPVAAPDKRGRLVHDASNREAGNVLPEVLANIGLTPLFFFQTLGALGNALLVAARVSKGALGSLTVVELVDSSVKSSEQAVSVTLQQCAVEIQGAIASSLPVARRLTEWIAKVLPYRPALIPDWQTISRPGETPLRLLLLPTWQESHSKPPSLRDTAEKWKAKELMFIPYNSPSR